MHRKQGVKKFWILMIIILLQPWSSLSGVNVGIVDAANQVETTSLVETNEGTKTQSMSENEVTSTLSAEDETGNVLDIILTVEDEKTKKSTNKTDTKSTSENNNSDDTYLITKASINDSGNQTYQEVMGPDEEELYYYSNILTTDDEKKVYDKIVETILATINTLDLNVQDYENGYRIDTTFDSSLSSLGLTEDSIKKIVHCVRSDHPEWYWFSNYVYMTSDYKTIGIRVERRFLPKDTRDKIETDVMKVVDEVESEIVGNDGVYEKVKKIHDYIITNTYYVATAENAHNILGALLDGEAVCESYAKASQLLFNYFDIQNVYVTGTDQSEKDSGHAWNQVYITEGSDTKVWVNYDATWDDLEVDSDSNSYSEFNGISYRYFCRNDEQFAHSKYTADYAVKQCTIDRFNYFDQNDILYIQNKNNITAFMSNLATMIANGALKPEDGYYIVRVGYDVSLEYSKIRDLLTKDYLICDWNSGGKEGDQYLGFRDSRYYRLVNSTTSTGGTLFNTLSDYKNSSDWKSNYQYTIPLTQKTFYIQTQDTMQVENVMYKIGENGREQHLTLSTYLLPYDASENLYICTLPIAPNEGDTVYVDVSYTDKAKVDIVFEKESYTQTYGEAINLKIHVAGTLADKPLTGTIALYKDTIDEQSKLSGFEQIAITNGVAVATINNGQVDLTAGTYTIYAVYQGDSNYPSNQNASTTVTVSKATLYFTPDSVVRKYGQENELTGTYSGFKYGETREIITTDPSLITTATTTSSVGSYPITAKEDGVADNYNIKITPNHNAKLTVEKAEPEVSLSANLTEAVVGETITLTVTITNKYLSTLTDNLPTLSQTELYLGDTKSKQFEKESLAGVYTCEYTVGETTPESLNFKAVTQNATNYTSGTSNEINVTVNTNSYLVSFDTCGFGDNPGSQRISKGSTITQPDDPKDVNKKYQFDGWYTSTDWSQKWSFGTDTVNAPMTLYAKWKQPELNNISGVVITPYTGYDYDGNEHEVAKVEGILEGDRVTYTLLSATSSDVPKIKNAGTYNLTVTVERDWCNPYITEYELTIKPIEPTIHVSVDQPITKEYTGNPITLDGIRVTGINDESVTTSTLSYVYYVDEYTTTPTTTSEGAVAEGMAPSKAGTYYVKVYFGATGNYKSSFGTAKVIIDKADILDIANKLDEVAATQADEYEYVLSNLLPTNIDFGGVTFVYKACNDPDNILAGTPIIQNGKLLYQVVSAEAGKQAVVTITIQSRNYQDKDVKLIIRTKEKTAVTITGVTAPDAIYDGKPYEYQGSYTVKNASTDALLSLTLEVLYTGTTKNNEAYSSSTAPTDAGDYVLTLSVPNSDKTYVGSESYQFTIAPRDLEIRAVDMKVNIGAEVPTYQSEITGLVETDSLTGVILTCGYTKNSPATTYDITISGGVLEKPWNYNCIYVNGTLTVKDVHTITFDSGVSGATNPSNITASEGTQIVMPSTTATKDGYDFVGWVAPNNAVYRVSEIYIMIDEDVTFKAKWQPKTTLTKITATCNVNNVIVGTTLTKDNFTVTAHYSDGTKEEVQAYTLSGNEITKEGDSVITITYYTHTANLMVSGYVNSITKLEATYNDTVMSGQQIDTSKLTVEVTYKDGTVEKVTSGYTISTYTITVGTNKLTLTYDGSSTIFEVKGVAAEGTAVLTFDSQGGLPVDRAVVDIGKTYSPAVPLRTGYIFKGWFTGVSGQGTQFTASTIVTGSATYYAYWEAATGTVDKIYVTYHGELLSGELKTSDFIVMAVYDNYTRGMVEGFTLSTNMLVVGTNKIVVRYENASVLVTLVVPDTPKDLTITMKDTVYASGYRVTKDDMTVVATLADGTMEEVTEYTLSNNLIHSGTNTVSITYEGFTKKFEVEGKTSYTVTFNSNGGSTVKSIQVISGRVIGALTVPTKKNCTFEGWYFDSKFTRKCTSSNKITKSVTLYAKWNEECPYTISSEFINVGILGQDSLYISGADYVQWTSDDLNIASIDRDGIITGINKGTVEITGYTSDGYELSCIVTVGKEIESIRVSSTKLTLSKGDTYKLNATVSPNDAATQTLNYSSSDVSVVTVNQKGKIVAKSKGTCYIIIQTTDSSNLTKKIKVTVK